MVCKRSFIKLRDTVRGVGGTPRIKRWRSCFKCGSREYVNKNSGLCAKCAVDKVRTSIQQLQAREGPIYQAWLDGLRRAVKEAAERVSEA